MERVEPSLLRGLAAFRWLAWVWMAVVLFLARGNLVRPSWPWRSSVPPSR
jgi:hypothetical protein